MAFREKSAWLMAAALLLGGLFYAWRIFSMSTSLGTLAPPDAPTVVAFTVVLVLVSVVGHILLSLPAPREANTPGDEREQRITARAGQLAGYPFAAGIVLSLGYYLLSQDGHVLFYGAFGSLMLGQLADYVLRAHLYRSAF